MGFLRKSWQFQRVYRAGMKIQCKTAVIFFLEDDQTVGGCSIGVVASKRVGNAVKRNRAKRLLRAAARSLEPRLHDRGCWIVLVAKRKILEAGCREVLEDVDSALAGVGLVH